MPDERPWRRVVWRGVRGGASTRRDAFAELHSEHASGIYNLALRLLGNREDAQDVSQDVLLKAFERLGKPGELNQRAWLYRVTVNACYDHLRARKRRPAVPWQPELELALPATIDHCEQAELRRQIEEAFRRVPPAQRAALLLREIHGLHTDEVAYALGVKTASAEVTLVRARTSFRRHFVEISGSRVASGSGGERRAQKGAPRVGGLAMAVGLPALALKAMPLPECLNASALLAAASAPAGLGGGAIAGALAKITAALSTKAAVVALGATVVAGSAGGIYSVEHSTHGARHPSTTKTTASRPSPRASSARVAAQQGRSAAAPTHASPGAAASTPVAASSLSASPSASPLVVGESGGSPSSTSTPSPDPTDTASAAPSPVPTPSSSPTPSVSPAPTPSDTPSPNPAPSSSPAP